MKKICTALAAVALLCLATEGMTQTSRHIVVHAVERGSGEWERGMDELRIRLFNKQRYEHLIAPWQIAPKRWSCIQICLESGFGSH